MEPVDVDTFEQLVATELDRLPEWLTEAVDNVVVIVEDSHPEGLLGLWEGYALTERDQYGFGELPDRVTLYRLALCDMVADRAELIDEIHITLVHELAHHLGLDDDQLHELGWG